MPHPLRRKLANGAKFDAADVDLLDRIVSRSRRVGARTDIIHDGDAPEDVHLVQGRPPDRRLSEKR